MRFECMIGRHIVAPGEVCNQGFGFSHCEHCERDLVRSNREWRTVPRGFRVVWRHAAPRRTEIEAAQLLFDLPAPGTALIGPINPAADRISGLLDRLSDSLHLLMRGAAGRLQAWRNALLSLMPVHPPMLRLATDCAEGS
jgi:hypothetical protein